MVSEGSWFWLPHGMVSSILYYCYYALCYGYEQVVLYCDCYAQTCFLSFSQCSLSSGIVLLCISICTLYRLLPVASFWLLYYCVGFAVSLWNSCVLFSDCAHGHARYQDIMRRDQLWLGNVCFVTLSLVKHKQFNVLQPWLEKHLLPSWPWPYKRSIRLN